MYKHGVFIIFFLIPLSTCAATIQIFYCFGVISTDPSVCGGHGECVGPDECVCEAEYYGSDCSEWDCFGINGNDPAVCSGHGGCTGPDQCICNAGWTRIDCSTPIEFDCFGIDSEDPNACSGHGVCTAQDTCQCDQDWTGDMCETCFYRLKGDLNKDCIVDWFDLAELASVWLVDCIADSEHPECIHP
jgi:hypothetical protein